jgi:hypothetical protein
MKVDPKPDTASVVNRVTSQRKFGRSHAATPTAAGKAKNNMVAANASAKRRSGRGR